MSSTYCDRQKDDDNGEGLMCNTKKSCNSADHSAVLTSDFKAWTLLKDGKPGMTLILKLMQSHPCESLTQDLFLKRSCGLGINIPKQLVSSEEKYLKRFMGLIHVNVLQRASRAISVNLGSLDMGFVPFDVPKFTIDYPMDVETDNLMLSSEAEGIKGSIMGSNSMVNILSSPLFKRLGVSDHDTRLAGTELFENKRCISFEYPDSPGQVPMSPPRKLENETSSPGNQRFSSDSSSQGMLQCMWDNNGFPHFTFSLDDQKEVYTADVGEADVIHEKALDYIYYFHINASGQKVSDISGIESDLIGKMKVSSSSSICSGTSKVMATEFVLVGTNDNQAREIHTLIRNSRRGRKLSKVMEVFKVGPSFKQLHRSRLGGSNAIPEDFSEDKGLGRSDISDVDFLPNFELAAILVKDHLPNEDDNKQQEVEGWGIKFLKKPRVKPTIDSSMVSTPSECSTSMDIIVPAGSHGGPRTKTGGPSSLIERWRSGGHCDCGSWDMGCPLKVIKARQRIEEGFPNPKSKVDCKSFDMFTEGSKEGTPTLKMVNIREGLYFISFQSSLLSALQCFAIAVATIHSRSPRLRPKRVKD
ncbi:hypothetical protein KSS87_006531 [Heliosperma pusillum]|nr:hypothetical protein KSS87_006531 [Heliosperma pusillum]